MRFIIYLKNEVEKYYKRVIYSCSWNLKICIKISYYENKDFIITIVWNRISLRAG